MMSSLGPTIEGIGAPVTDGDPQLFEVDEHPVVEARHRVREQGVGKLFVEEPDPFGEQGGELGDELGLGTHHPLEIRLVHHQEGAILVSNGDAVRGSF